VRLLDGEEWQSYTRDFKRSAFRMEVHPVYTMPGEAEDFRRFRKGEPMPEGFNADWHDRVRANVAAGKTMHRVKVIWRPFNKYTSYLFRWAIPGNVAAGEDYRIIDITDGERPAGLDIDQDWWFFDDSTVVLMNYQLDGQQISRELLDDPDLDQYRKWRDLALSLAVPYAEYMKS
jgi:hypothetical protein